MRNLPYDRSERVAKRIYQIIAAYIYEKIDDERLVGIQFTGARLTRDFSLARVYFFVEGGKEKQEACLEALEGLKPELKGRIGHELVLKTLPKLEFHIDEGMENAKRIEEIISSLKR